MAKVFQFLIILAGLSLLLGFLGVSTGGGVLLRAMGYSNDAINLQTSQIWIYIVSGIFAIAAAAELIYGLITRNSADSSIRAALCGFLATFVADFIGIINYFNIYSAMELKWVGVLVTLIYTPMLLGYLIALVMFWGGNDI